ncbi:tyrosine-protein phosphatase [Spirillospora sp. NPDC050679]
MQFDDEYGHIALDGAENVRDLGGIPLAGGGEVAAGRLLRADALNKLTDADLDRLADVRTVIDFRTPLEVRTNGADRLPAGAELVALPVAGGDLDAFYEVIGSGDPDRQEQLLGDGRTEHVLVEINRNFVAMPIEREKFAAALTLAADEARLPLLFHCTAGKDRTGWMAAIVLTIAGASRADIMADYMRSNDYHQESYGKLLAYLGESGQMRNPELLRPMLEQRPAYLEAAFEEVERMYGTFDAFLAKGLNLAPESVTAIRDTLRA